MNEPVDRREFLDPHRLLRALGNRPEGDRPAEPVVTLRRAAMACLFEIQFPASEPNRRAAMASFDLIDDVEDQLSIYRDASVIAQVNAAAHERPVPVPRPVFQLLRRCQELSRATDGAFDIAAGRLVRVWGFVRREGRVPTAAELTEALAQSGFDKYHLDPREQTVRFTTRGLELNLGSVGKGYALDQVAIDLRGKGFRSALLSAGHSSIVAIGRPTWDTAWQVELRHPRQTAEALGSIRLADRALSTSGVSEQFFEHEGRRYGHILDPRTGKPVEGMLLAAVAAPDAALAEALSTAFFVLGADWTRTYCAAHRDVGAVLLDQRPGQPSFVERLGSIEFQPAATPGNKPEAI